MKKSKVKMYKLLIDNILLQFNIFKKTSNNN